MADQTTTWHEALGERIREHREARGWSRNDLAFAVHEQSRQKITSDVLGDYERGERRNIDVQHMMLLAKVFEVELADLLPPATLGGIPGDLGLLSYAA